MLRTAVIALAAAVLLCGAWDASGPANASSDRLSWRVTQDPFRLVFARGSTTILEQASPEPGPGSRFAYRLRGSGAHHTLTRAIDESAITGGVAYTVATTEPDRTGRVTVRSTKRGVSVTLELSPGSVPVDTVYEAWVTDPDEHFLGGGEIRETVDLRNTIVPLKVWHPCGSAKPAPFFISSRGYGIAVDTTDVGRAAFGRIYGEPSCDFGSTPCAIALNREIVQLCVRDDKLAYEVLAGSPQRLVSLYAAREGRPQMPAVSQFEVVKWRDETPGEAELMEDLDRFEQAGIPLGWVLLDNPWQAGCAGPLRFDTKRWPDARGTIRRVHERGVRFMIWVSPTVIVDCSPDLYPADAMLGTGRHRAIDLTRPEVRAAFEKRLGSLFAMGIDGVKGDRGDEVDFERASTGGGPGTSTHNLQPLLFAQSVMRTLKHTRQTDAASMFRSGYTGSPRAAPGFWIGDLPGSYQGLERAIRGAQTAGVVGYSTWGSDIGGYMSESLTADVFVRWAQLGSISPIFEVGGNGRNAEPWELGNIAMQGLREAAVLHYELFPYLFELARRASVNGVPILRPLALQHPDDERAWAADLELLVGPDLLAAPVTTADGTTRVYLPAGTWIDLHRGTLHAGRRTLIRSTPLLELPLYLRSGAAVPFDLRRVDVWQRPWRRSELGTSGRGGWVVGRNGGSGASVREGTIRASRTRGVLTIALRRAPLETAVVVAGAKAPRGISVGERTLTRAASPARLRTLREGWAVLRSPYRGVVVKLSSPGERTIRIVG